MRKLYLSLIAFCVIAQLNAQTYTFEDGQPSVFEFPDYGLLSISTEKSKEGQCSLLWEWNGESTLKIRDTPNLNAANNSFSNRGGVTFWIYNEKSRNTPLVIRFVDDNGNICYQFNLNLTFTGWKACWMAFINMQDAFGQPSKRVSGVNLTMEMVAPQDDDDTRLFIDRFKILTSLNAQTMPDAQIPENNAAVNNGGVPSHWGRLWEWEVLKYDTPLPNVVTTQERADVEKIRNNVKSAYKGGAFNTATLIEKLKKEGIGVSGALRVKPLVTKVDPFYDKNADYNLTDLASIMGQLSRGWYASRNEEAKKMFVEVVKWAMDQGFMIGSCMGGNDHYGYETRAVFTSVLWMKESLKEAGILDDVAKTMSYWSGLPETRQPYELERGELVDAWNTLVVGRLCAALLYDTDAEQVRALRSLYRWVGESLCVTPGTIGGIKPDYSGFHHGGHYPAYAVPGYASVGEVIGYAYDTQFEIGQDGKNVFKKALLATGHYSNQISWGIGLSGRHPLNTVNQLSAKAQQAFGHLARAFSPVDKELAAEFLRVCTDNSSLSKAMVAEFTKMGIEKSFSSGFFPFNWSCFGVFRKNNWMLSMKGYNKYVWGSEIYTSANRYGRYQSYGSTQIIVGSEVESRWEQPGWNWNRLPGTTTIHLPLNRLESPSAGTLMEKSSETFSGAIDLAGKYGMFATKLQEGKLAYFTSSFVARKSVFCVDNRAVCLGTGISNMQKEPNIYPTETILFQQKLKTDSESFTWKGEYVSDFPYNKEEVVSEAAILSDLTGNYYRIESGQNMVLIKQEQTSKHDETKADTKGKFATAYINHGNSPVGAKYEYMITIQATEADKAAMKNKPYTVLKQDNTAHIVEDNQEKVVGYAFFEDYFHQEDRFIASATGETLVMLQYSDEKELLLSVCDPNINIGDNSYSSPAVSIPVKKKIVVKGQWTLTAACPQVDLSIDAAANTTTLQVTCVDGLPIYLNLSQLSTSIRNEQQNLIFVDVTGQEFSVSGSGTGVIYIYNMQGVCIKTLIKSDDVVRCTLSKGIYVVHVRSSIGNKKCKIVV